MDDQTDPARQRLLRQAEVAAVVLAVVGWLALGLGTVAAVWTYADNSEEFAAGQATVFFATVLGPAVIAWGVCIGLATLISLGAARLGERHG